MFNANCVQLCFKSNTQEENLNNGGTRTCIDRQSSQNMLTYFVSVTANQ